MKAMILSAAFVLISSSAYAYPAINDSAVLTGTYQVDGGSYPLEITTSIAQYDASTKQYLQNRVTSIGAQQDATSDWMDESEFTTEAFVQELLVNCAQRSGSPETITVAAGTFDTCKIALADSESSSIYWIGDVPFGIVKAMESGEGFEINAELSGYAFGQ